MNIFIFFATFFAASTAVHASLPPTGNQNRWNNAHCTEDSGDDENHPTTMVWQAIPQNPVTVMHPHRPVTPYQRATGRQQEYVQPTSQRATLFQRLRAATSAAQAAPTRTETQYYSSNDHRDARSQRATQFQQAVAQASAAQAAHGLYNGRMDHSQIQEDGFPYTAQDELNSPHLRSPRSSMNPLTHARAYRDLQEVYERREAEARAQAEELTTRVEEQKNDLYARAGFCRTITMSDMVIGATYKLSYQLQLATQQFLERLRASKSPEMERLEDQERLERHRKEASIPVHAALKSNRSNEEFIWLYSTPEDFNRLYTVVDPRPVNDELLANYCAAHGENPHTMRAFLNHQKWDRVSEQDGRYIATPIVHGSPIGTSPLQAEPQSPTEYGSTGVASPRDMRSPVSQ